MAFSFSPRRERRRVYTLCRCRAVHVVCALVTVFWLAYALPTLERSHGVFVCINCACIEAYSSLTWVGSEVARSARPRRYRAPVG